MPEVIPEGAARPELAPGWSVDAGEYVTALGWSASGALCAAGAASGQLLVVDAPTGAERFRIDAHPGGLLSLAWSPKRDLLATAGQDGNARLVRGEDGALVAELRGDAAWVEHVAWSPDGKALATASGRFVRTWRADGSPIHVLGPHASTISGLAWSRKGTRLAASCYGGVQLWDAASGAAGRPFAWKGSLISLAWSPDDQIIACGSQDCSVHFWRLNTGQDAEMSGYSFKPKRLAWSADATLLATGGESTVSVWDFKKGPEGTEPILLEGHQAVLTDLAFSSRGGLLATGAQDSGVIVWEPRRRKAPRAFGFMEDYVSALAWRSAGDRLAAADASGRVTAWSM